MIFTNPIKFELNIKRDDSLHSSGGLSTPSSISVMVHNTLYLTLWTQIVVQLKKLIEDALK